jgi:O-methyltransferase
VQFDMEPDFLAFHERCAAMTMTSVERMYALYSAVRHLINNGIAGDFVECGVWRGGSAMMMALTALSMGEADRAIWLYDTFSGMTAPGENDVQAMSGVPAATIMAVNERDEENPFWGIAPRAVVEANMRSTAWSEDRLNLIEGNVLETLPGNMPEKIALLRLDTDWYQSTLHELETLYPRLCSGGVLIIDDYGYWTGARRAVDDYFGKLENRPFLSRIDFTGRLSIKI